jgi:hypothetical protein
MLPSPAVLVTFDPATARGNAVRSWVEVVTMTEELWLTGWVREWAERALPGDRRAADRAVALAVAAYAGGASLAEACATGQHVIASCSRHPSHHRAGPRWTAELLPLAPVPALARTTADRSR